MGVGENAESVRSEGKITIGRVESGDGWGERSKLMELEATKSVALGIRIII